jgi:hypothetical protein
MGRGEEKKRVAIGGRPRDGLQRNVSAGAGTVIDDDRLPQAPRQRITDDPANEIGDRSGRKEDDQ